MHFPTALVFSLLPLSAFAAAVPQKDTAITPATFTTSTGEELTVHPSGAAPAKRAGPRVRPPPVRDGPEFVLTDDAQNRCGDSTFHDKTGGGSPLVADCKYMADFYRETSGTLSLEKSFQEWAPLGTWGTCTIGAHTKNILGTRVGNTDVADMIDDAIKRFQSNGRVAVEGDMGCSTLFQTARVDWSIYHRE
ncbi:hypothetical protein IMZ48_16785 [Candidatus Bathyarchaeota archaeon]|nr:hypothetical protein [Candidatus Bathyarchaeota archaeon]